MKFVTHQTTLHLSFKMKCCVDRLRPPSNSGHPQPVRACPLSRQERTLRLGTVAKPGAASRELRSVRIRKLAVTEQVGHWPSSQYQDGNGCSPSPVRPFRLGTA